MKPFTALCAVAPLALALATPAHADDPARYKGNYYNPTNTDSANGFTSDYEQFLTIGCPGKSLFDKPCDPLPPPVEKPAPVAAPAPAPAPVVLPIPVPVAEPAPAPEPAPEPVLTKEKPLILKGVNFDFDSHNLKPAAKPVLDQAAEDLKQASYPQVRIDGYTDSIGAEQYNMKLSQERADSVKRYLVDQGVPADSLATEGHGETNFVAPNDTKDGRYENRRVELHVQ